MMLPRCPCRGPVGLGRRLSTSGNWYEPAFLCTLLALGAEKILFAVDWPLEANKVASTFLENLPVNDTDKESIASLNAVRELRL